MRSILNWIEVILWRWHLRDGYALYCEQAFDPSGMPTKEVVEFVDLYEIPIRGFSETIWFGQENHRVMFMVAFGGSPSKKQWLSRAERRRRGVMSLPPRETFD